MIFVHQVVACSESHESGVVRRRWDGDGAGAADVRVAQLVGQELQLISSETVVIPEDVVMGGTTGSLRTEDTPSAPRLLFTLQSIQHSFQTTLVVKDKPKNSAFFCNRLKPSEIKGSDQELFFCLFW